MLTVSNLWLLVRTHRLLSILGGIAIFFCLLFILFQLSKNDPAQTDPRYTPPTKEDYVLGDPIRAKGVLVVYTDLACLSCGAFHSMLLQLHTDFGEDLSLVYRHLPLSMTNPNADMASALALVAGQEEKHFEMVELLFNSQREWRDASNPQPIFSRYAGQLGLDQEHFAENMESALESVHKDAKRAREIGIKAAPTFFLNGRYIEVPPTPAELRATISTAIYSGQ